MRVWTAGPHEADQVARLLVMFRDWWGGRSEPTHDEMRAGVEQIMSGEDGEFLLASAREDLPQGVCQIRFRWSVWTAAHDCWLEDLYVTDEARGAGLGRALVEAAVARARSRGCRRIELDVNEQNEAALALYLGCGFTTEPKPPGRTLFVSRRLD